MPSRDRGVRPGAAERSREPTLRIPSPTPLAVDLDRLHFFDPDSGLALAPASA